jgi:beta-N-acetylhexosaminidase
MHDTEVASVGDHFLIGLRPGTALDDRDRELLSDIRPSGVILYKSNFEHGAPYTQWLESHAKLIDSIRHAVSRERLFIAIDHEGGRVCRTPPPITRYSYATRWAQSSQEVGACMGTELASLGVNLNFAPVLDIDSNPANPVIGQRSFGRTPDSVILAALPFINAMERHGVRACAKHFPGHGDTKTDSHSEVPRLDLSLEALETRELRPFRAAIRSGIGMLMTSHLLFTSLDAEYPVTLSRKLTYEWLRSSCGFE